MKPTPAATAASIAALCPATRSPILSPLISNSRVPPAKASAKDDGSSRSARRTDAPGTSREDGSRVTSTNAGGSTVFSSSAVTRRPSFPLAPEMTRLMPATLDAALTRLLGVPPDVDRAVGDLLVRGDADRLLVDALPGADDHVGHRDPRGIARLQDELAAAHRCLRHR